MILQEGRKTHEYIFSLVQGVHTFSEDTVMEFEIKKCGVTTSERRKVVATEEIKLLGEQKWWCSI